MGFDFMPNAVKKKFQRMVEQASLPVNIDA